jgi:hypothetical protein
VLKVVDGEFVRTKGAGVGGFFDGFDDGSLSERGERGV